MKSRVKRHRAHLPPEAPLTCLPLDAFYVITPYLSRSDMWNLMRFVRQIGPLSPTPAAWKQLLERLESIFVGRFRLNVQGYMLDVDEWKPDTLEQKTRMASCPAFMKCQLKRFFRLFPHIENVNLCDYNGRISVGIFPRELKGRLNLASFRGKLPAGALPRRVGGHVNLGNFNKTFQAGALPDEIGGNLYFWGYSKNLTTEMLPRHIGGVLYLSRYKGYFPPSSLKTIYHQQMYINLTDEMRRDGFYLPLRQ